MGTAVSPHGGSSGPDVGRWPSDVGNLLEERGGELWSLTVCKGVGEERERWTKTDRHGRTAVYKDPG